MNHNRYRTRRFQHFLNIFKPQRNCRILDVGGSSDTWFKSGLNKNVTLLNLTRPRQKDIEMGFTYINGDALHMDMIEDQSYDIVYSNSVIEHVGGFEKQKRFASEIKRVGKSFWVQTPNRFFPVEPHLMFPFSQFMPPAMERWIAMNWPGSNYRKWGIEEERVFLFLENTHLLSESELKILFPTSNIFKERVAGFTKSMVAWKI